METTTNPATEPAHEWDFEIARREEFTIDELLAAPLTRVVMKADNVDPEALKRMLRSGAIHVRDGARATTRTILSVKAAAAPPSRPAAGSARTPPAARAAWTACGSHCSW
jgi:hypothetical protein